MERSGMRRFIPMIGNVYGQLTVIDRNMSYSNKNFHWNCKCTCGNIVACPGTRLRSGHLTMCPVCVRMKKWQDESKAATVQLEIGGVEIPLSDKENKELRAYLSSFKAEHRERLAVLEELYKQKCQGINSILEEKREVAENIGKIIAAEKALNEVMGL